MRFLTSVFFSWINSPWIHMLKYFRKYFCFRRDIHEIRFFHGDFWVTVPGNKLISGYCYPEINWFPNNNTQKSTNLFPGIVNRKSIDFRVMIPRHFLRKQLLWIFLEIWAKINKFSQKYTAHFLGIVYRKSINFQVSWPGSEILQKNSKILSFKQLLKL